MDSIESGNNYFCDEYDNKIDKEPSNLGLFGVNTIIGISCKVIKELIIQQII